MQSSENFNKHLQDHKNYDEELAERAFSDYYGVDKSLSWRNHYGDKPYSTYWAASAPEREAMKEELGIAAQQREASAKAAEMYGSIRAFAVDSGLPAEEARALVGNTVINVFREEHVRVKELKEELYWKETSTGHKEVPYESSEFPKSNIFTVDLFEENRVEMADRLKDFPLPGASGLTANDLKPEALKSRFSEWKFWIYDISDRSYDARLRGAAERMYPEEHADYDNRSQNFLHDDSQSQNSEKEIVNGSENAVEQREALAEAEKLIAEVKSLVAVSGYTGKEAFELMNDILKNVFREQPDKNKNLKEALFGQERQEERPNAPVAHSVEHEKSDDDSDELIFADWENDKVDLKRANLDRDDFERDDFERDDFVRDDFARNHFEPDIDRLLFGDESTNALPQLKEESQLVDRWGLRAKEEREDDERSR